MYINQLRVTGGARIGFARASWPFAILKVSRNRLEINAFIIGNLVFSPADIISIEINNSMALIGNAIKINHRVQDYNAQVIFLTFENPSTLISQIKATGFLDPANQSLDKSTEVSARQQSGGFPIKIPVVIGIVVLCNLLFLSDLVWNQKSNSPHTFGFGVFMAMALVCFTSILTLFSKRFARLILKDHRSVKDIDRFLYLIIFITGIICIFSILLKTFN